ncbi:restriction endonuclease subunit S [Acinetobacter sp.]|uniref:restriction endonuclease subunit S n=1 Tax=Acinetobacter sp. TaxID=472 RepID=UPI003C7619AF
MKKKQALAHIASIQSGLSAANHREVAEVKTGFIEVACLNGNNLLENGLVQCNEHDLKKVCIEQGRLDGHVLLQDDILLMARGSNFRAALFKENDLKIPSIASPNIFVIRCKDEILPEVVVSFINSSHGQALMDEISIGSTVRGLSISSLKNLEFNIPDVDQQKLISSIFYANIEALGLLDKLKVQQQLTVEASLQQLMM